MHPCNRCLQSIKHIQQHPTLLVSLREIFVVDPRISGGAAVARCGGDRGAHYFLCTLVSPLGVHTERLGSIGLLVLTVFMANLYLSRDPEQLRPF
jgi:hypothetical protein